MTLSEGYCQLNNRNIKGRMLKPEKYCDLYERMRERGVTLLTPPREYELFHIFPNVYSYLKGTVRRSGL